MVNKERLTSDWLIDWLIDWLKQIFQFYIAGVERVTREKSSTFSPIGPVAPRVPSGPAKPCVKIAK